MLAKPIVAAAISMILCHSAYATDTIIHAGKIIIGSGPNAILTQQSILVEKGKIESIQDGFVTDKKVPIIDLSKSTVMPGLMDLHVHITSELNPPVSTYETITKDPAHFALMGTLYAKRTLHAGFTTVRDLGGNPKAVYPLRDAINSGIIEGPRIYAAGQPIATTGGHGDPTNGLNSHFRGDPGPQAGVVNGYDDALKAVRQHYKDGADVIKLTVTGGVLSLAKNGQNPQFTSHELEGVMQAAKDYEFSVAVHAHGAEGMKRAIRAGVDSVEHGTYMDDEVIELMKQNNTYYVPTISAGDWVANLAKKEGVLPEVVRPKAATIGPLIQATFSKAYKAGVNIAFGTDSGVSPHGQNAYEFELMVEAGMTEIDAILSATKNAATLLRIYDEVGSLEPGKKADIIAVDGDPLNDISELLDVDFVMKNGIVVVL